MVYASLDKPDFNGEDYQCPCYVPSYANHVPSSASLSQHNNAIIDMTKNEEERLDGNEYTPLFTVPISTIEDIQDCMMNRIALYSTPPWLLPSS